MLRRLFRRYPSIKLNVIIYQEGNEWVAHCLQMDIVTANTAERSVESDIIDLIKAQVIYAIENDNLGNIFKPAPPEEWAKLEHAKKCGTKRIKISVHGNEKTRRHPPINEVELCFA